MIHLSYDQYLMEVENDILSDSKTLESNLVSKQIKLNFN